MQLLRNINYWIMFYFYKEQSRAFVSKTLVSNEAFNEGLFPEQKN